MEKVPLTVLGPIYRVPLYDWSRSKTGHCGIRDFECTGVGRTARYEIARRIEQQTQGKLRFTLASLLSLLYRMEKQSWVRGEMANWRNRPTQAPLSAHL